ncbi:MAG: cytochrome c1 [Gammaproteobacteria bacterium]|jgi:ubiquinol-cytochrome c reductase cytochrome c1 subunit|nr:cytochrome c1 [Gammaproteobacteria bacterium]MBT5216877.1 cytochrome c1 [Gammaproteobacteria bacterium]MBT5541486.1 cytochrome c1 [Gammaproteobacteria bacterium]MBT6074381.1 cytochrome c1 [Gammaproteobacteria bacterium]MBT7753887.1 cytochrome c1 [Gammaproteobacteria bacterium]
MKTLKKLIMISLFLSLFSVANSASVEKKPDDYMPALNDVTDLKSLQRGARNFFNYCAGCHSLKYVRYNQMAKDIGISEEELNSYLIFTDSAPQDVISVNMLEEDGNRWFGKAPPDLSMITRVNSNTHIYNFLRSFYPEKGSPTGTNNRVKDGTSMPNVLSVLQDEMNKKEFDSFVLDIVNFLDYAGEPIKAKRKSLGIWVMCFLFVFLIFSFALYKDIWKEVK